MAHAKRTILLIEDEESITTRSPSRSSATASGPRSLTPSPTGSPRASVRPTSSCSTSGCRTARGSTSAGAPRRLERPDHHPLGAREEADRVVGLELGADDYVVKPFSAREVIARIRAVLRRAGAPAAAGDGRSRSAPSGSTLPGGARLDGEPVELARKEFDLLALLMREAGTVVTRERLIDEVWDVNWFGSTKTLDVHIGALRKKLGPQRDPHGPRRRLSLRLAGRAGVSLRLRLLAAFAYVLVLVLIALEIPLVLSLSNRVDNEVRSQAAAQAQVVAAAAARASATGRSCSGSSRRRDGRARV